MNPPEAFTISTALGYLGVAIQWGGMALCLALGLLACDPPDGPGAGEAPEGLPPILLSQVLFEGYSGALRDVVVRSRNARVDARGRLAKLEDVRIRLDSDERGSFEVSSPRGQLDLRTDDFKLEGGVEGDDQSVAVHVGAARVLAPAHEPVGALHEHVVDDALEEIDLAVHLAGGGARRRVRGQHQGEPDGGEDEASKDGSHGSLLVPGEGAPAGAGEPVHP